MTSTSPTAACPRPTSRTCAPRRDKGVNVVDGAGTEIRYIVFNVKKKPVDDLAVRKAVAQVARSRRDRASSLQGHDEAAVLDGPGRVPGRQGVLQGRLRRSGSGQGEGDPRRGRRRDPGRARRLVHADALRPGRGRPLERDQAPARGERPVQGQSRLDRVGPVQGRGLRPRARTTSTGSAGSRTSRTPTTTSSPFMRDGGFFSNGYSNKDVNAALDEELATDDAAAREEAFGKVQDIRGRGRAADPAVGGQAGRGASGTASRASTRRSTRRSSSASGW